MRVLFIIILVLHGLIHLMGFVKAFRLGEISQLTQNISRPAGLLWLLTALLFLSAALVFLFRKEAWWIVALLAVVLSQTLIIIYWQDAKYGTIANVLILAGIVLGYGVWEFNATAKKEWQKLGPFEAIGEEIVSPAILPALPPVVQTWLKNTNVIHNKNMQTCAMQQTGRMRTSPEGKWYPFEARQWSGMEPPGFLWVAQMESGLGTHVAIRDTYSRGKGNMFVKLFSLITIEDAKGSEIDQGALLRFLGEIVWTPSYALSKYIHWEADGEKAAKATMEYGGISASALFTFNEEGYVKSVEAQRYFHRKEGATLEKWVVTIDENSYKAFENIIVPQKVSITWKLKEGDYHWYDVEVKEVRYNVSELLPHV